jgi:steroid 5-alpha reductase family enzyme
MNIPELSNLVSEIYHGALSHSDRWLSLLSSPFSFWLIPYQIYTTYLRSDDPLSSAFMMCLVFAVLTFLISFATGNCSQVDRVWSILPIFYAWHFVIKGENVTSLFDLFNREFTRADVMALLVTVWGLRLTYNYWRKGGYKRGHEDYRWEVVRNQWGWSSLQFQIFNFFFISLFQNLLIFLFSLPIYGAIQNPTIRLDYVDYGLVLAWISLFFLEVTSDEQQWNFQEAKKQFAISGKELSGDYAVGFLRSGFFSFSRHPNFFAEFSMWWVYYFISAHVTGPSWLIAGPALLTVLFHSSTNFTEELSVKRHPKYAQYQQEVSRLLPWFRTQVRE